MSSIKNKIARNRERRERKKVKTDGPVNIVRIGPPRSRRATIDNGLAVLLALGLRSDHHAAAPGDRFSCSIGRFIVTDRWNESQTHRLCVCLKNGHCHWFDRDMSVILEDR